MPSVRPPQKSLLHFLWEHRWFLLTVFLTTSAGAVYAARLLLGPAVVVDYVKSATLVETVVASGHIESPFRVEIGGQITGTVADVLVSEGDHVMAGQSLIALDARELKAVLIEAQGALAQAHNRIRQLKELTLPSARQALAQAQANEKNAQLIYDRAAALIPSGYETRAALDEARKNLEVAHTQVHTAELQVFSASPGGSDYLTALTQVNQAQANRDAAQSRLGYATITAPRDGVLIARNVERGSIAQPGKALLVLAPSGDTEIVLAIDERNLGKIAIGQTAIASADAYPNQRFEAIVSYINPSIDITKASVEVKLTVPNPPEYIRQDMTVSVDIAVARRENALSIPTRDVHDALSGAPWVMAAGKHRASRQPVELGIRGNAHFEITKGLSEGSAVVPVTSGIRTGQRIRPVTQ